ncbi:hypothetical protein NYO67_11485 [Aspergillus flavus]|nr:hypothetical protein NYO67_11485 [Aspergillus flavus]
MAPSKVVWPRLTVAAPDYGNEQRSLNKRVLDLNHDANSMLADAQAKKDSQMVTLWTLVTDLTEELAQTPLSGDLRAVLEEIRRTTYRIEKSANEQTIAISHLPPTARWAESTRQAPPPSARSFSHGSNSTPAATPSELGKDCEVIVKLGDSATVETFRKLKHTEIRLRAERARLKGSKTDEAATLASTQFVAARQLKSGDLSLTLRNAKEAEIARCHRSWVTSLGAKATIRLPTWGVVVHDFPVRSVGDLAQPRERDRVTKDLLAANRHAWGEAEVAHLCWLTGTPTAGKKSSAIVVEFTHPMPANNAIDRGTIWDSQMLTTVLYDRSARIRRCYNCQQFGHIGTICSNPTICGTCAEGHQTWACTQRAPGQDRKCANCGGPHAAWYSKCEKYQDEVAKVAAASIYRERHHRIPPYLQDFDMDTETSGSEPIQQSSSSVSAGRSSAPARAGSGGHKEGTGGLASRATRQRPRASRGRSQTEPGIETRQEPEAGAPPMALVESLPMEMEVERLIAESQTDSTLTSPPPTATEPTTITRRTTRSMTRSGTSTGSRRDLGLIERAWNTNQNSVSFADEESDSVRSPPAKRTRAARQLPDIEKSNYSFAKLVFEIPPLHHARNG